MKKKFITVIGLLFIILLINLFASNTKVPKKEGYRISLFETSDIHGYIANKNNDNYEYLLSYISDKVKDVRGYGSKYDKDKAILLDGGDIYQGSSLSNLIYGASMAAAYQIMDYDAVTIGNHEFDWGIENTVDQDGTMVDSNEKTFKKENKVPVIASNLYKDNKKVEWANDYVILTKKAINAEGEEITVKIGVIGYLANYASTIMRSKFSNLGYSIKSDPNIVNEIAKNLEKTNKVDMTILLCHADAEVVASTLGETVIDLVLGGHSHQMKSGEEGIPYIEPGKYGDSYSYLELVFAKEGEKSIFQKVDNMENIKVIKEKTLNKKANKEELDQDVTLLTDKVLDRMKVILEDKIGYIVNEATKNFIDGSGNLSTTGGNWISSVYKRAVDADVAFTNYGGIRFNFKLNKNKRRDITLGDIYSNYPFDNEIYKYEVTYEELLKVLTYALKDDERRVITSIVGIDCYFEGNNINAIIKDGILVYQNGTWKDGWENKTLTIATNEYVATANGKYNGMSNPMIKWNKTDKLLEHDKIDSASAIEVLKDEASKNNGLLIIDTKAYFIEGKYQN